MTGIQISSDHCDARICYMRVLYILLAWCSVDGMSDPELGDPYDELGRTPPRAVLRGNRKWADSKKHIRDSDKR